MYRKHIGGKSRNKVIKKNNFFFIHKYTYTRISINRQWKYWTS